MTEEIDVVPETNGEGDKEGSNGNEETMADEPAAENASEKENGDEEHELHEAIVRQVEYYFGDVNLPRDKFLREQIKLDDGWIPLEVLTRFNRLSKLTTDVNVLQKALNKSTSGLLEVQDMKIRRNPELPVPEMNEDRRKQLLARTIYAKGFPKDIDLDTLLKHFKQFDEVENLIMRRYLDKRAKKRMFKGSVFATFKTKDQAEKFMEEKNYKYQDSELIVLWQEDYLKQKHEEFNARKDKKKDKKVKEVAEKPEFKLPAGTVLYFDEVHEKLTREDIKTAIHSKDKKIDIAFIDFKVGQPKGWIRFAKENAAKEFHQLLDDGSVKIGEHKVTLKVLEGEEEKEYLDKTIEEMSKRRQNQKTFKHKGKGHFKGKHGRKRRQDDHEDAPPAKVQADDS